MEAGDFQKLAVKQYPPKSIRETAEGKFWKSFGSPVLAQHVGPVSNIDFSPVGPQDFAVTSSTRVSGGDWVMVRALISLQCFLLCECCQSKLPEPVLGMVARASKE